MEVVGVLRGTRHKLVKGRWFQKARTASEKGKQYQSQKAYLTLRDPFLSRSEGVREREIRKNTKAM